MRSLTRSALCKANQAGRVRHSVLKWMPLKAKTARGLKVFGLQFVRAKLSMSYRIMESLIALTWTSEYSLRIQYINALCDQLTQLNHLHAESGRSLIMNRMMDTSGDMSSLDEWMCYSHEYNQRSPPDCQLTTPSCTKITLHRFHKLHLKSNINHV